MAYPVQSLPDGSIKMSDGTIQPPKGAISPRINLGMPSFTETPATSSGASFVNRQNSISKNIIGPSINEQIKKSLIPSLPKENEPMYSETAKRSLWKTTGLPEASFDINAFQQTPVGMEIKPDIVEKLKPVQTQGMPGIDTANAGENQPLKLFSDEQKAYNSMLSDGIGEQEATDTIRTRRAQLLGGNTQLTDLETRALQKMREDGMSANEATESLTEFRKQREELKAKVSEEQGNISPVEKFTNALIGASVGALETTGKMFDFVTGSDIGDQIQRAKEKHLAYKGGFGTGESIGKGAAQFGTAVALSPQSLTASTSLLGTIGQGAVQGAVGMIGEKGNKTTAGDIATGTLTGGAFGAAGYGVAKGLQKGASVASNYLQSKAPSIALGGLINPQKLEFVKKALQMDEGVATPKDVGKWILDRVRAGDKESIANQLIAYAEKTKGAVDEALSAIPGTFKNADAQKALSQLKNDLNGIAGMESKVAEIDTLLAKGEYSLPELNAIKRELDQTYNVYKQSGEVSANLKAQGLNKVRAGIRSFIEDEADKFGVDIRKLNNETSVARGLADGILKKDNADAVRQFLTAFAPSGLGATIGAGQSMARGEDPITVIRDAVLGGLVAKAGASTIFRTKVASLFNELGPKEMGALEAYIKSGGKDVLGQKVAQDLAKKIKLLPAPSGKATFAQRKSIILPKSVTETKLGKIDIGKAKMGTTDTKPLLNSKILELPAPRLPEGTAYPKEDVNSQYIGEQMNSKKSRESTPPVPPELKALIEKKPTSSLIEEAKKYKSADEFIQNKFVKKEKLKEGLSDYKISVKNGYVEFSIDRESGELIIDQIAAYEKNKGTGTKLLRLAEMEADKRGLNVSFAAEPQDNTITKSDLYDFYEKRGYSNNFGLMDKPYEDLPTYREQMKKSQLKQIWEEANKKETKISLPQKKVEITNEMTGYKKQPLKDSTIEKISNPDLFVENLAKNNQSYIEKYGREKFNAEALEKYKQEVKTYISKGYDVPQSIIDSNPEFSKAVDARARYEKGLYTSFSNKDVRINETTKELIGGGVKRQDGKEITPEQVKEIVDGVTKTTNALNLDIKKLAEGEGLVFVHLNGKNPFLKSGITSGMYRKAGDKVSVSVGGTESATDTIRGVRVTEKVHTTMAHEIGHALDSISGNRIQRDLGGISGSWSYNPPEGLKKYFRKPEERAARMIEQYVSIKEGDTHLYEKAGYWKKGLFDSMIPQIEKILKERFPEYIVEQTHK